MQYSRIQVRKNTDLSCDSVGPSGSCICGAPSACPMMRLLAGTIAWAFYSSFERERQIVDDKPKYKEQQESSR